MIVVYNDSKLGIRSASPKPHMSALRSYLTLLRRSPQLLQHSRRNPLLPLHQTHELRTRDLVFLLSDDYPHPMFADSLRILYEFLRELGRAKRLLAAVVCER